MSEHFDLIVSVKDHSATFRLLDNSGAQIAYRHTDFTPISVSRQHGLFDLRDYVRLYVAADNEAAAVAEIGVCIAEDVLGREIFEALWRAQTHRTLRIQLPGATEQPNPLAAALARVPWEIARPAPEQQTLAQRNLIVRIVNDRQAPASQPLASDEALRVLFVFAEARDANPLGLRRERRELMQLFEQEIYPQRRVVADFLTHGVTRERLEEQIRRNSGYHIVHWSGHGHKNQLLLAKPGGKSDLLTGQELLALFTHAGGFLPRLFFLSACHSGDVLNVGDWNDFLAVALGQKPEDQKVREAGVKPADLKDLDLEQPSGYTGTAHALLQGGVPSVVAMRYAVGDDYARELAVEFYRALLADTQPKDAASALNHARSALQDESKHDPARYAACDHATPLLYSAEQPGLTLNPGRSTALDPRDPRLHHIAELTTAAHRCFVGRTWALAGLGANFIAPGATQPVAVITGLGGMGKTALTAEALALWEKRFTWVLLYQAKPNALNFDHTLRDIHQKLNAELGRYHHHIKARPADAIHREADAGFTGDERLARLTRNLVRALRDEAILLVLDNFETNLEAHNEAESAAACQDPAWDRCLSALAHELGGAPSRVLITCRRPLAAPAATESHSPYFMAPLGPLPAGEAALYLREHPVLSRMVFGAEGAETALAQRLLKASRFHPLLMDRLARLAADAKLRPQLMQALETLETTKDYAQLPELFASRPGDAQEIAYLNDALAASLDQLIHAAGADARRLLWIIATANEPVALGLLKGVWSGEDVPQQAQLRQIKQMLEMLPLLPAETQAKLKALPPEFRALLDALPPVDTARPDIAPLLDRLVSVGLATAEHGEPEDENPDLSCHELVRERIRAWMERHPQDRTPLTENAIRLAYAERLEAAFKALQHQNMTAALEAGSRALVYCVQAGAWDRLGGFAGGVVTGSNDPRLLAGLIPHLRAAADSAPQGKPRWSCLCYLADALRMGGRPDAALPFYEQAATLARAVAEAGGADAKQAWADFAAISANQANAFAMTGNLDAARQKRLDSAKAEKSAGNPAIQVIVSELEALRIDIMQGKTETALPGIETRLTQIATWWQQHRSGQPVPEAPDAEFLARAFIGALDIARQADYARKDWASALRRIDAILEVMQALERPAQEIAATRFNRANVLGRLGRYAEAKTEMETCLPLFQNDPAGRAKVLSSLADLFDDQGDIAQALTQERRALAIRETLPDPADRAISHHNLANYLQRSGAPSDLAESPRHQLAALVYCLVAGLGQHLQTMLRNYAIRFRNAADAEPATPGIAELLADPAFDPLKQWLNQRSVNTADLQAAVDQLLEQARQTAAARK